MSSPTHPTHDPAADSPDDVGATPTGVSLPDAGGLDPIFQKSEPVERPQKSTLLLWQFFLFPLLIVAAAVGVFVLFGAIAGAQKSPEELLDVVIHGGANEQQQAAHQLALVLQSECDRVERMRAEGREPDPAPFYEAAGFRKGLRQAYELALKEGDESRLQMLALAIGRTGDTDAVPLLLATLYPEAPRPAASIDVRRRAAQAS